MLPTVEAAESAGAPACHEAPSLEPKHDEKETSCHVEVIFLYQAYPLFRRRAGVEAFSFCRFVYISLRCISAYRGLTLFPLTCGPF